MRAETDPDELLDPGQPPILAISRRSGMRELAAQYERLRRERAGERLIVLFDVDGTLLALDRPIPGAFDVVRWFQMQPDTFVGINSSRDEGQRPETLEALARWGAEYRVSFEPSLVRLASRGEDRTSPTGKLAGLEHFRRLGYRVFACVDSRAHVLEAIARHARDPDLLLLHAGSEFRASCAGGARTGAVFGRSLRAPRRALGYSLDGLISRRSLPEHVQLVWSPIDRPGELDKFLGSAVRWGRATAGLESGGVGVRLRDPGEAPGGPSLELRGVLERLDREQRGLELVLTAGGELLETVDHAVRTAGFDPRRLGFHAPVERVDEHDVRRLSERFPESVIHTSVDFLSPLIARVPAEAERVLDTFLDWGIRRFSISWRGDATRGLLERMERWGYEVLVDAVPDLEAFLQAVLLLPRSIAGELDFPQWRFQGRGHGRRLQRLRDAAG